MHPILLAANIIALGFTLLLFGALSNKYRLIFIVSALIPLALFSLIAYFAYDASNWGFKEYGLLLLRGGFILAVIIGALACYLTSSKEQAKY